MKIVCGSCGAKYSIADEKVQGKVFKIRCRKCSNVIVVKGDEDDAHNAQAQMSAMGATSASPEWYVVIDGEQAGPLTPDDIESYFIQGRISGESYAWRDGMPDWSNLSSIDTFSHLFSQGGYEEDEATQIAQSPLLSSNYNTASSMSSFDDEPQEDATAVMDADAFRNQPGFNADPFGAEPAQGASLSSGFGSEPLSGSGFGSSIDSGFSGYGAGASGGGLATLESESGVDDGGMFASFDNTEANAGLAYQSFAGLGSGPSEPDFGGINASPSASPSLNSSNNSANLIGQRNENSVLFSLSSLQKVEAVSANQSDAPTTEGSGLIDIQALASTHKQISTNRDDGFTAPTPDNFSPGTMSMPAIMPKQGTHRNNTMLIGLVVGAVLLLAGVGIAAIVIIGGKEDKPQVIVQKEIIKEVVKESPTDDAKLAAAADEAAKKALAANTPPPTEETTPEEDDKGDAKSSKSSRSSKGSSKKDDSSSKEPEKEEPKETKSSKSSKKDGIDSLLAGIDKKDTKKDEPKTTKEEPAPSNLPEKLSKPQVQGTFSKYAGRVSSCSKDKNSGGLSGTLWVRLKIEPNGSVSSSDVDSKSAKFKGTDVGNCVVGVVKSMKFPASKSDLSFSYPMILK